MTTSRFTTLFSLLALSAFNASSAWASQHSQDITLKDIPVGGIFLTAIGIRFAFHFYYVLKLKDRRRFLYKNFQQQKTTMLDLSRSLSDRVYSLIRQSNVQAVSPALLRDIQACQTSVSQFMTHVNDADFETCVGTNYDEVTLLSEGGLKSIHFRKWDTYAQRFEKQLQDLEQRVHHEQKAFLELVAPPAIVEESTPSPSLRRFKKLSRSPKFKVNSNLFTLS